MAVTGWLLLSLLTVQTITGREHPLHGSNDVQKSLKSDSYDWKLQRKHRHQPLTGNG